MRRRPQKKLLDHPAPSLRKEGNRVVGRRLAIFGYPTESFFALGVKATDKRAIQQLFRLKKREAGKPIALIAADVKQVQKFFVMNAVEKKLAKEYWPGPLTILLKPKSTIQARALGAKKIGVRVPAHAGARRLAARAAAPLTATSANISGQPPTKSTRKLKRDFPDILIAAGRCGKQRRPSTIISVDGDRITIIRPGAVHVQSRGTSLPVVFPQKAE